MRRFFLALSCAAMIAPSAQAGWTLMSADTATPVVNGAMKVTPGQAWNRWTARPSNRGEIWTLDGLGLNELSFFAGIRDGETLYHEQDRRNLPLPRYRSNMSPLDVVELFEGSNRILLQSSIFEIGKVEPAKLAGHDGVRFQYRFVAGGEELARRGEGVAAIIDGKLYLVNFAAPAIHYFDRDLPKFHAIVDSISI